MGCGAFVHYGVTIGDHVILAPDSFLMKGEILDPYTTWRGNPAKAIRGGAIDIAASEPQRTQPCMEAAAL